MTFLSRNKLYTGEKGNAKGGASGPLNDADYGALRIVPLKQDDGFPVAPD